MALWHHHADAKELERFEVHAANSIRWVAGYERAIESSFPDSGGSFRVWSTHED